MIKLSVVIPSCRKSERLYLSLCSYINQTIDPSLFEVIVILNCDDIDSYKVCKGFEDRLNIKIFVTNQKGMSVSRNIGARLATGSLLGFFDDDILLCPQYLDECFSKINNSNVRVVRAPVYILYELKFFKDPWKGVPFDEFDTQIGINSPLRKALISPEIIMDYWHIIQKKCTKLNRFERIVKFIFNCESDFSKAYTWMGFSGSGVIISDKLFWSVGGFDEQYDKSWGAESLDVGYKLMEKGAEFVNHQNIYSVHMDHPRSDSLDKMDEGFRRFYAKYNDTSILNILTLLTGTMDINEFLQTLHD